ncbi:MAG: hypothetical protein OJJ54_18820 [Pseudonocardia sp.]|nr:hypothetical protein [Pseudonocardia sp.]
MSDGSSSALPLFEVTVTREDTGWCAVVDDVPGSARVETFAELDTAVRRLVESTGPEDFDLFWNYA